MLRVPGRKLCQVQGVCAIRHEASFATSSTLHKKRNIWHRMKRRRTTEERMEWARPLIEYGQERRERAREQMENPSVPHMLHVVRRVKPLKGRPWWEKQIMEELGLDTPQHFPVIHKNVPSTNMLLDRVKHLIEIKPLTFVHGIPDGENDHKHITLKPNGELVVKKEIEPLSVETTESENQAEKWRMTDETIEKQLYDIKRFRLIHAEYVKPHLEYTHNQDGKEYRYSHNKVKTPPST